MNSWSCSKIIAYFTAMGYGGLEIKVSMFSAGIVDLKYFQNKIILKETYS